MRSEQVAPLEKTDIKLGYIPLTDCAPFAVAKEKGFFEEQGLNVSLSREHSWASIRDKVGLGVLDGAQMLASMPVAARLGVAGPRLDMVTGFVLDLNGNAITLSKRLYSAVVATDPDAGFSPLAASKALNLVIRANAQNKRPKFRFGVVFPVSTQNYELRYWLGCGGTNPDLDVEIVVIPPPDMVDHLQSGDIDGYCVGEPWNTVAVRAGLGHVVATKYELWNNSPEKVFAVARTWSETYPGTHRAIIRALMKACAWLDQSENRLIAAEILTKCGYIDQDLETVALSLCGISQRHPDRPPEDAPDFHVFNRYSANFPWLNQAEWFIAEMYRWGQLKNPVSISCIAEEVYLPELYREVAVEFGVPCPAINRKTEGNLSPQMLQNFTPHLGPNQFIDGKRFDVGKVLRYLEQHELSQANISELRQRNETIS
jgi:nitrate/nitrite transport system substrate-binding protein